ncbi:hypothetical protein AB0K02_17270 [Streptomyces sp. NPDC049597]|uniref:hypothetical protein n=1 Tax=Streptomyces sp. NPDC049597 TaxID=3155276 RepID=UPI003444C988
MNSTAAGPAATETAAAAPEQPAYSRDFGTGLLRTRVTGGTEGGGYTWVRRPGPQAPAPFAAPVPDLDALIAAEGGGRHVLWASGAVTGDGAGRVYRVRGPESAAGRLLYHGPDDGLVDVLRDLGRLLRALHDTPVPPVAADALRAAPRGLVRFTDWLAGRSPEPRAAYAESLLRPRLGEVRMAALHELCERIAADGDRVLCHGAPALGSLVPAQGTSRGDADMLIGEDVCLAPWYLDLGWTLGELVELKWYRGDSGPAWPRLLNALFEGYGRDLGDTWPRLAALRVLLHLHDYTAYVGWDEENFEKYTGFVMFLLDL